MKTNDDAVFMQRALELARRGEGHTRPNPPVGAVLVQKGKVIGEGWHRRAGLDHAEVDAIKCAVRRGHPTKGATLYVTLEPCSKPGRVGACTDAIKAARIARVVYGAIDPNPKNRGRASRVLAAAGIRCVRFTESAQPKPSTLNSQPSTLNPQPSTLNPQPSTLNSRPSPLNPQLSSLTAQLAALIAPFAKHVTTGLPYVTVKIALSLDGRICDDRGDAKWVSSERARKTTGKLRERVDAVMVGAWTVRKDDPSLLSHGKRNDDLVRVVVSRSGRLPRKAQIFTDGRNPTLVYRDARAAIVDLGQRGMTHVLCEGGLGLATSLAKMGVVDEWITVLAPKVIGTGRISEATKIGKTTCLQDW